MEGTQGNGAITLLDTLITPQADGSLSITVYQKPFHTDQYLQWDSHHSLSAKYSVIGTLTHRAKTVCNLARTIKESIYIRVNNPNLNQNTVKYNLRHIWDRVLFNTSGLKLGSSQQPSS